MQRFARLSKWLAIAFASVMLLALAPAASQAATGRVHLKIAKAGFIIGVGGGNGTLTYRGRTYRLNIGGVSLGSLGVAEANLVGTAKNLRSPGDIAGTYTAVGAGAAIGGGGTVATLQNEKGVVLTLQGPQVGFQLSLGLAGMTLALQ